MGFWHTGYIEFHEPTGLGRYSSGPPERVRYACEHCAKSFGQLEDLRRHRFEAHPLRQPAMLIRGRPASALPMSIVMPLLEEDVVLEDVLRCTLNGQPVPPAHVGKQIAAMRQEYVELTLSNEGAATHCVLDFRIADPEHLAGVEDALMRMARDRALDLQAISRFSEQCRQFTTALSYCDGICHYLYGVMAKERSPHSGLQHEQYVERYLRATEMLAGFERPLARTIRALVAFHFNHFDDADALASDGRLKHAARAFGGLLQGKPWQGEEAGAPAGGEVDDLLTDQDTFEVLADASCSLAGLKAQVADLLTHLRRAPQGYDRFKRLLLAAEALAAEGSQASRTEARKLARELVGQAAAANWAEEMIAKTRLA